MTSLDRIRNILIAPMLANMPVGADPYEYLADMWCLKTRIISRYVVDVAFDMPGHYLAQDCIMDPDTPYTRRQVKKRHHLYARIDDITGVIDVEYDRAVFRLTREEWDGIRKYIRLGKGQEEI